MQKFEKIFWETDISENAVRFIEMIKTLKFKGEINYENYY